MTLRTSADERRTAVRLAKRLLSEPGIADDVKLLCATLCDVQDVFVVHAPVIQACKNLITRTGQPVRDFTVIYNAELVPAVLALYKFDREMETKK